MIATQELREMLAEAEKKAVNLAFQSINGPLVGPITGAAHWGMIAMNLRQMLKDRDSE